MDILKKQTVCGRGRRLLSMVLALLMVFGALDIGVFTAYAKEPEKAETATVTLYKPDHGTLSFSDADGSVLEAEVGKPVTVTAVPNDGYVVEYISTIGEDDEVVDLTVEDNSATFEVKQSVEITASFKKLEDGEEEAAEARPFEMDVDESADISKTESVEDYILSHADKSKVGMGDKLTPADMMWVAHTFVDGKILPNATLDTLWGVDKDKDGYSDNVDAFLSQSDDTIVLYRLSDDAKYFVGKVGNEVSHAKVTDWVAGRNDISGTIYDDIIYDDANRLVYVPSKYQITGEDGKIYVYQTKLQLVYTILDKEEASAKVAVEVENDGVDGDVTESGSASGTYMNPTTEFMLANDAKAAEEVSLDAIDSVIVNGIEFAKDSDMWSYEEETGKLTIRMSPITVDTVEVKMSDGLIKNVTQFFRNLIGSISLTAEASADIGGEPWMFDETPVAGKSWTMSCNGYYHQSHDGTEGGISGLAPAGGALGDAWAAEDAAAQAFINAVFGGSSIDLTNVSLKSTTGADGDASGHRRPIWRTWAVNLSAQDIDFGGGKGVSIPGGQTLDLVCAHVAASIDGYQGEADGTSLVKVSILAVDGANKKLLFGVVAPTVQSQAGYSAFWVSWDVEESDGQVRLKKYSTHPEYTKGNACYNMKGIKYGIYSKSDKDSKGNLLERNRVAVLTVKDNTGLTNYTKDLAVANYWVQELPEKEWGDTAKGYLRNNRVKAISITADKKVTRKMDGNYADGIKNDPTQMSIQKAFEGDDEAGMPRGDIDNYSGIQFRVDYYAGQYSSEARAKKSGKPDISAIFETNKYGEIDFTRDAPVEMIRPSGTNGWPYKLSQNRNTFPLGTVVVSEVKALEGMKVAKGAKVFNIVEGDDGNPKIVTVTDWPEAKTDAPGGSFPNELVHGGVHVEKASSDTHTQTPDGDGSLEGIEYTIYNRSKAPVKFSATGKKEDAKEIAVNGVVTKIYTKYDAATETTYAELKPQDDTWHGLEQGTYQIVETAGSSSYRKGTWAKTFSIKTDGQIQSYNTPGNGWNEDEPTKGNIEIVKVNKNTKKSTPEGDADLAGVEYTVKNASKNPVTWNNQRFGVGDVITKIYTKWDASKNRYSAQINDLEYGTYNITETGEHASYNLDPYTVDVPVHEDGKTVFLEDDATKFSINPVKRGGIMVTKADADWNTSNPQGDATLEGVTYEIINRSERAVTLPDSSTEIQPGEVVMTIQSKWDEAAQAYVATTGEHTLSYGTYDIVEKESSVGYLNAGWKQTGIEIRAEGEMHCFDEPEDKPNVSGLKYHNRWNVNPVQRGGIIVGKVDRETEQYISLGEAHLDGAVFKVINRSKQPVYVNGKTYAVGDVIMTITTKKMEYKGETVYAATTGEKVLPYGTYEIQEISSGTGYLYDKVSKAYTKTVSIRKDGEMKELIDPEKGEAVENQVLREDFHFKKKQEDSMERMDNIPFLIESLTTGERHVITTDENGTWDASAWDTENTAGIPHTQKTNENDPTSPITNGALGVDENGDWYVKDASKLNHDAGTWFTGMPEDMTKWAADGKSYEVNGKKVDVQDDKRAFPYDTYRLQELRCPNNEGYGLISVTVTLHRYTANHDGKGISIDYGTLDDKVIEIGTTLTNKATSGKVAPANSEVLLMDTVTYGNLSVGKKYTMKGELHLVNEDNTDAGVISTATKDFTPQKGSGRMTMDFKLKTDNMDKKHVVAFEYLLDNGKVVAEHADLTDEDQTIRIPKIGTTLKGDLGHMSNGNVEEITLVDTVAYENFEVGKEYTATGTLMKKVKDEDGKVTPEPVLGADGKPITAMSTFVALEAKGTVDVTFKFSGVDLTGETVVAFETVTHNDVEYAVHADIDDEDQSVTFPKVDTFAVDTKDANKDLAAAEGQSITDNITVKTLADGYEYKLVGNLSIRNADGMDEGVLTNEAGDAYEAEVAWEGNAAEQMMVFEDVDASKLGGKDIVVYQMLYGKTADDKEWKLLGEHRDIKDADQSVHVPFVHTTLVTGQKIHESQVPADGMVTLTDTVSCKNITPGHNYAVVGFLHVQDIDEDGNVVDGGVVENDKKPVTATAVFTAENNAETVDVTFEFDATGLEGKSVTAFEYLYSAPSDEEDATMDEPEDEWLVASHEDITDMEQTVTFVDIGTTLTSADKLHETQVPAGEDKTVTLTDVVAYHGLIPGREYTVTGTLHKQAVDEDGNITDGGAVMKNPEAGTDEGEAVTASATFVPAAADGEVEIVFTFDATGLDGKTVVAFESVSTEGITFAVHADITDESQSVSFVKLGTTALAENGLHEVQIPKGEDKTVTIVDAVKYEGVIPGNEYTMSGTLHIQSVAADGTISDGGAVTDKDGNPVTGEVTFTPETASGFANVPFTFDASALDGKTVVAFEALKLDGKVAATHEDITDKEQSVTFVDIRTNAVADNGLHEIQVPSGKDKTVTVTDRVDYFGLTPGTEYTMSGVLHVQKLDKKGNITDGGTIESTKTDLTFTPKTADGFVELKFKVDASELAGRTVVAFEELSKDGITVATHTDITDEDQSVHFVAIETTALAENGRHMTQVPADGKVTITDTVSYTNLVPGMTYKVAGTLHVQDADKNGKVKDGGIVELSDKPTVTADDGKEAKKAAKKPVEKTTVEKTFTPKTANGTVDMKFTFDASELGGKTVVAFETLSRNDKVVATHEDITDESQSVSFVQIRTKALAENGKHEMELPSDKETVKITDLVEYRNLTPGLEYTVIGELHVQSTNKTGKIKDEGILAKGKKPIRAKATFKAKEANGSVTVEFEVPTKGLENRTVVAFETLLHDNVIVATHVDINDEYQSVMLTSKDAPGTPTTVPPNTPIEIVKTGQAPFYLIFALLGIALMAGAGYVYFRRKRV